MAERIAASVAQLHCWVQLAILPREIKAINKMNDDFKFLTTLCGIYAPSDDIDALKIVNMLTVYANARECSLRICYKSMASSNIALNKGEIAEESGKFLLELGYMEFELIYNNCNKDIIKELIFSKYQDYIGHTLYVTKVY